MDLEVGAILVRQGLLTAAQLRQAMQQAKGRRLTRVLADAGWASPEQVHAAVAAAGPLLLRCGCPNAQPLSPGALLATGGVCPRCGSVMALGPTHGQTRPDTPSERTPGTPRLNQTIDVAAPAAPRMDQTMEVDGPAVPADTSDGKRRCGRYELIAELGSGAFGSVYRAYDPKLGREVAVKLLTQLDATARQRFAREVQVTARMKHPNLVAILDHGEERGHPFLVMEMIQGQTLEELATRGKLSVSKGVELVLQVCEGMQHAHDQGILHRDLKPENVLVDERGQARVVDFGLARVGNRRSELTLSGTTLGTPYYMAPEQAGAEHGTVGPRSDLYSLGGVLYCVLTGHPPLEATSEQELWMALFRRKPKPPSSKNPKVPAVLDRICLKCLEKQPEDRYESVGELGTELRDFLDSMPAAPTRKRGPLIAVGVALAALVLAVALWATGSAPIGPPQIDPPPIDPPPVNGHPIDPPPVDPPPDAELGTLRITSTPSDAEVLLRGPRGQQIEGRTPFSRDVPAGRWKVVVRSTERLPDRRTIQIDPNKTAAFSVALRPRLQWSWNFEGVRDCSLVDVTQDGVSELLLDTGSNLMVITGAGLRVSNKVISTPRHEGSVIVATAYPQRVSTWIMHTDSSVWAIDPTARGLWQHKARLQRGGTPIAADVRGNQSQEILIGDDRGTIVCRGLKDGNELWSYAGKSFLNAIQVATLTKTQDRSVLAATSEGEVVCLDGDRGRLRWALPTAGPVASLTSVDLDGDGDLEVLVVGTHGTLTCIDAAGVRLWSTRTGVGALSIEVTDLDGDGTSEIVVSTDDGAARVSAKGQVTRVYPGLTPLVTLPAKLGRSLLGTIEGALVCLAADGSKLWSHTTSAGEVVSARLADLDSDGTPEILVRRRDSLECLDLEGLLLWSEPLPEGARVRQADVDGDGRPELLVVGGGAVRCWAGLETPRGASRSLAGFTERALSTPRGVFVYQRRKAAAVFWSPDNDSFESLPIAQDWMLSPPAWDEKRGRALFIGPNGLVGWRPGASTTQTLVPRPDLGGFSAVGDRLWVTLHTGGVQAFPADRAAPALWTTKIAGRVDAPPLPLDLDGDGSPDRILIVTSRARAFLLDMGGRLMSDLALEAPVRFAPIPLALDPVRGTLPVLVACQDGHLQRVDVSATELSPVATWDLGHALTAPPTVAYAEDGRAHTIYAGTWSGWLHAVYADLRRARWTYWGKTFGQPSSSPALVDLDGDGTTEVVIGWHQPGTQTLPENHGAVLVFSSTDGALIARLHAGNRPVSVVAHPSGRGFIAAGDRLQVWEGWPRLHPWPRTTQADAYANLLGGAWEAARKIGAGSKTKFGQLLGAIAAWHLEDPSVLQALVREQRDFVEKTISTQWKAMADAGEILGSSRLRKPFGGETTLENPAAQRLPLVRVPRGRLLIDLTKNPIEIDGFTHAGAASVSFAPNREAEGVYIGSRGHLRLVFTLKERQRFRLKLQHRALAFHLRGFAGLRLLIDDSVAVQLDPPWWYTAEETVVLPPLEAGEHTLTVLVSDRASTNYALQRLELEPLGE